MKRLIKYALMALMLALSIKTADNPLKFRVNRVSPKYGGNVVEIMNFDISFARLGKTDSDKILLLLFNNKRIIYSQGYDDLGQDIIIKNALMYNMKNVIITTWVGYKFRKTNNGITIWEVKPELIIFPAT